MVYWTISHVVNGQFKKANGNSPSLQCLKDIFHKKKKNDIAFAHRKLMETLPPSSEEEDALHRSTKKSRMGIPLQYLTPKLPAIRQSFQL